MKRVVLLSLFFLLSMSLLVNAQTKFYGMQVNKASNSLLAFELTKNEKNEVSYKYNKNMANTEVYCWGSINSSKQVTYTISNNSKTPIKMNYFTDLFELMYEDGTVFQLKHQEDLSDIRKYPDVLNPGESESVTLVGFNGDVSKVSYMSASLRLSSIFIFLRKVPK